MSNEFLWFIFAIVNFIMVVTTYKLFGRVGLISWIAAGTVLANIQVTKTIELFGMTATLGNIMYGTLFLVTDALGEKYGYKQAKKAVWVGFFTLLATVIIMQLALAFEPMADVDWAHPHLLEIFMFLPQIAFGSLIAYIISQLLDVYLFQKIKNKFPSDKMLYLRNIGSTIVSQFIDTLVFVPIAFFGVFPLEIMVEIFLTTYFIKLIVAILDTPFVYLIKYIKPIND